jgi:CRP-like cAMP-binding protein
MVGVPVILGETRTPYESYAQVGGHGLEMKAADLWAAMKASLPLADVLLRFVNTFLVQVTHSALAFSRFDIEQRLARWLLMAHDRVDQDDVPLTHEFLSMMLGCRRASVTNALDTLEGHGLICSARCRILIRDRRGLEKVAGTCYGAPESELAHAGLQDQPTT